MILAAGILFNLLLAHDFSSCLFGLLKWQAICCSSFSAMFRKIDMRSNVDDSSAVFLLVFENALFVYRRALNANALYLQDIYCVDSTESVCYYLVERSFD